MNVNQVEYSRQYAETNPQAQSLRHLLSEAHLLLRAALLQTPEQQPTSGGDSTACVQGGADRQAERQTAALMDRQELEEALRQNCAQLGDCFSRCTGLKKTKGFYFGNTPIHTYTSKHTPALITWISPLL